MNCPKKAQGRFSRRGVVDSGKEDSGRKRGKLWRQDVPLRVKVKKKIRLPRIVAHVVIIIIMIIIIYYNNYKCIKCSLLQTHLSSSVFVNIREAEACGSLGVGGHPGLHVKFQTSQGYRVRPCVNKIIN